MTGFAAAFAESPVDFYKSQVQVQVSVHGMPKGGDVRGDTGP
jgi:hypothetical protein